MSWDDDDDGDAVLAKVEEKTKNSAWDDEDKPEVKLDSWEDEDKPAAAPQPVPVPGARKTKTHQDIRQEKAVKLAREREAAAAAAAEDPAEKKRRQQKLVEESDFDSARALFGGAPSTTTTTASTNTTTTPAKTGDGDESTGVGSAAAPTPAATASNGAVPLFAMPKDEAEFEMFAQNVSKLITAHEHSFHYMRLVKAVVKNCTTSFKSEEYKDLSAHINVLLNTQLAKEKKADGKKPKKGAAKAAPKARAALNEDMGTDAVAEKFANEYDDFM